MRGGDPKLPVRFDRLCAKKVKIVSPRERVDQECSYTQVMKRCRFELAPFERAIYKNNPTLEGSLSSCFIGSDRDYHDNHLANVFRTPHHHHRLCHRHPLPLYYNAIPSIRLATPLFRFPALLSLLLIF